jgi:hypothetical protein
MNVLYKFDINIICYLMSFLVGIYYLNSNLKLERLFFQLAISNLIIY